MRMKKGLFFLSILLVSSLQAQVKWMNVSDAVSKQKEQPKKILMMIYKEPCEVCGDMEQNTFSHPVIENQINEGFYPVKYNASDLSVLKLYGQDFNLKPQVNGFNEFASYMNVTAAPTIIFLDESGSVITKLQGKLSAKELEPYLGFISQDSHRKITNRAQWSDFQKKFKSKIRD